MLDIVIQRRQEKRAALKLMRELLWRMCIRTALA
jgi:hypothetical protein